MIEPVALTRDVISFGAFSLDVGRRLLLRDGAPVALAARTFDTLVALVSRAGQPVGKRDLLATIWPDVTVDEGSLRFYISALRKALGDGKDGARYIATLPTRGYCFVASITRSSDWANSSTAAATSFSHANLPGRLTRIVGRDDDVARLSAQLEAVRFVSIVGPGGVGKTTVGVAIGHRLMEDFAGAVLFVDLGMVSDPGLVPTAVASQLGLAVQSDDPTPNLVTYLRDKRVLLILDTCEHLIEAVATLASKIFGAAPKVHILATSREALQVEHEHVYRLESLANPPDDSIPTAAIAQAFPATQLFIERAVAGGARLDHSDAEASIIVDICRKLDGVALAIELAARRVETYGLQQTAALLDQRLKLAWPGLRTAPARQRTLQATLDWSYGLLSATERLVLRRLAVFVGHFTLDAAMEVAADATLTQSQVLGAIDSLVAKSMIAARAGAMVRYQLLDTTRAYALEGETKEDRRTELAARHALYYHRWLEEAESTWSTLSTGAQRTPYFAGLNNVRSALEWCFGPDGNTEIGVGLAAAAARVFFAMSLTNECHRWSSQAILALDETTRSSRAEMHLQATLGLSSLVRHIRPEEAIAALNRSLTIAERRGDVLHQVDLLSMMQTFHLRAANYEATLACARRASALSETIDDPATTVLAHSLLGVALHHIGDLRGSRAEHEAALRKHGPHSRSAVKYHSYNGPNLARNYLARTLCLLGYPIQARELARLAVENAEREGHPVTLIISLLWAVTVCLWSGDLQSTERYVDKVISNAATHFLSHFQAVGDGFKAVLKVRRGEAAAGVTSLQSYFADLAAAPNDFVAKEFIIALVQGLMATGRSAEGLALIDTTLLPVGTNVDALYMPELLRVKAGVLLSMPQPRVDEGQAHLRQSLKLSRQLGARAWELRAATDLAALLAEQGRFEEGRTLLQSVFAQFTEGRETPDLQAAERLLAALAVTNS